MARPLKSPFLEFTNCHFQVKVPLVKLAIVRLLFIVKNFMDLDRYIYVPQLAINDGNDAEKGDGNNLSYTWMMNLVQGDELTLKSTNYLHASSLYPLTFTGELIHIEN